MKRLLSILLIGALSASLLTGCAAKDGAADKSNKSTKANNETSKPKEEKAEYTLKDKVLVDNESYSVTVKNAEEYQDKKGTGIRLNVSMTNKTEEALLLNIHKIYINGYYGGPSLSWDPNSESIYRSPLIIELNKASGGDQIDGIEVPGGKTIEISCQKNLQDYMGNVADEITFRMSSVKKSGYDPETASRNYTEFYSIYPTGKTADTVEYPEPEKVTGEKLIEDNEYVKLIFQENKLDEDGETWITYYAENKSDSPIYLNMTNIKMNGKSVNAGENNYFLYGDGLNSGKREINFFYFGEYTTGYTVGEEIKELSFTLTVEDSDSRSILYTAEYTVTF